MGHLINPIAFRLGHTRSWEDSWFVKGLYYPEFLHSILKIRQYIYYFWTTNFMEKSGFLLSHFSIYKFIKNLLVKIFLYNTDFEKYIYAFYARGIGIFSDSFYFRLNRMKKRKEPSCYQRYKPDLFFLLFLYHSYFTRNNLKRRIKSKKNFFSLLKKKKKSNFFFRKKDKFNDFKMLDRMILNDTYFSNLKDNKLSTFLKLPISDDILKNKQDLSIPAYENKIKLLSSKKYNMGFLDFLIYTFLKINMLEKSKEDKIKIKRSRRRVEMVMNYSLKIRKWMFILKKFINVKVIVGDETNKYRIKRSLRNFIFFLVFFINYLNKMKRNTGSKNIRLRELNLKLIRLFIFNRTLTPFVNFYGKFLTHILLILTKINSFNFKFCFISNNSVNARFLTRYMGLKLRSKFPLFVVINPLKKEFRKLSRKKKEKKNYLFFNYYSAKIYLNKRKINYKESYVSILKYLYNKYLDIFVSYYKDYKMLITFDIFFYFIMLKKKFRYKTLLPFWKKMFMRYCNLFVWKKDSVTKRWINLLKILLQDNVVRKNLSDKLKLFFKLYLFIKNKLLINLFFSSGKYDVDSLVLIFFTLKGDIDTFFFFNSNYVYLTIYSFFYNYILSNQNTLLNINKKNLITSIYFFKSFMFYMYVQYGFNKLISYLNLNKKNYYLKIKKIFSTSSFILGYKMSFKGRFTRKQRASSVWFHQGFVPLNTVKGCVDYSFFTIPLKNSAVSIKLWLYKNTNGILWDHKLLNKK